MMFDGRFMAISKMELLDSQESPEKDIDIIDNYLKKRFKLYDSADYCKSNMKKRVYKKEFDYAI